MPLNSGLSAARIGEAIAHTGMRPLNPGVVEQLSVYCDLIVKWNNKLNLTAIRDAEGILWRHFLECIFCAQLLPNKISSLMDFGSGAGFPGIPIALCRPDIRVTLCEAQGKKAAFLREAVRSLDLTAEVYNGRVEELRQEALFDAVAMRAVERMDDSVIEASRRVKMDGLLVCLGTKGSICMPSGFTAEEIAIPWLQTGVILLARRAVVPRGTLPS